MDVPPLLLVNEFCRFRSAISAGIADIDYNKEGLNIHGTTK